MAALQYQNRTAVVHLHLWFMQKFYHNYDFDQKTQDKHIKLMIRGKMKWTFME